MSNSPNFIKRYPLWSFFILAYAINFAVHLFHLYVARLPAAVVNGLDVFSPTISALVVTAVIGGMPGIRVLLSGFTRWNVSGWWYLAAFSLTGIPLLIALVYALLGNPVPGPQPGLTPIFLAGALLATLLRGPLSEEAGWRGFALPRLQQRYSALTASIILGVIWACWHIPSYIDLEYSGARIPFAVFVPMTVCLSILFTWIYNNTGGSLLLTVFIHFCYDFTGGFIAGFLGLLPPMVLYTVGGGGIALITLAVVLYYGPRHLSRKPEADLPPSPHSNTRLSGMSPVS